MFYYLPFHPILVIAAIVPAVFLMIKVYKADKLESEPLRMMISLVILGMISTLIAVIVEDVGENIITAFAAPDSLGYNIAMYFIVVAFGEEGAKYFMLKRRTWRSREFNCQFDGVIYAVFISLGFALWENIGYVLQNGMGTALLRAVTAVPGHACFGVFMGIFYGIAKRYEGSGNAMMAKKYRHKAVWVPALIHGAYDFLASYGGWGTLIFFLFIACMFFIAYRLVHILSENDRFI